MTQLYDESVLEISFNEDMNERFVGDSEPSKGDPLSVQWTAEPIETDMPPNLPFQPELMRVIQAVQSNSELSIGKFEVPANYLALRQISFSIMAMHIFNYLSSGFVNPNRLHVQEQENENPNSDGKSWATQIQNCLLYYLNSHHL